MQDFASYVQESIPTELLERMNLKQDVLDSARGPIQRFIASRWLCNMEPVDVAKFIHDHTTKDVIAQWEKVIFPRVLALLRLRSGYTFQRF
jgi:hypothetical protein